MKPGMRLLMEEFLISVIIVRFIMWVSGYDLFVRGSESGWALGFSIIGGVLLTAIYNGINSEVK